MKRKGKLAVCVAVLLVLLGLLLLVTKMNDSGKKEEQDEASVDVTSDEADQVTAVAFQIGGQEVSFTKSEETWVYDQDPEFPLNQTKIDNIVEKATQLKAEQVLEDENVQLADYGLEQPTNVIRYTAGDKTTEIAIGDKNATTSLWYLYLNENTEKIYLVNQGFDSMFPDDMMSFADGETLPTINASNSTRISVEGNNGYRLEKEDGDSGWEITDASGFSHGADVQKVGTLTSTISSMSYGGMKEYNCQDMATYGLDHPQAVVKVHYTEEQEAPTDTENTEEQKEEQDSAGEEEKTEDESGETITVEKDLVLLIGARNEDGNYYATTEGSKEVHTLSESTVTSLLDEEVSDYWDLSVSPVTVTDIKSLDVSYQGQTRTITRTSEETTDEEGNTTETVTYTCDGKEVDKTEASTLYSAVISMQAQSKGSEIQQTQEDTLVLTIHTEDASYTVSYSPYDSSFYYTEDLEGVPSLVNKNDVNTLIRAYETVTEEDTAE